MASALELVLSAGGQWLGSALKCMGLAASSTKGPHHFLHRCPLKTLQKCEIALEKLKNDMAVVSGHCGPVLWEGS